MKKKVFEIAKILSIHNTSVNYALLSGYLGETIFLYWYSLIDHTYSFKADIRLEQIFDYLTEQKNYIDTYCNGLAGLGISMHLLEENGFIKSSDDFLGDIDSYLEQSVAIHISKSNYDFLHGVVGIGFYFLKHYNYSPQTSKKQLECILKYLTDTVITDHVNNTAKWEESYFDYKSGKKLKRFNISLAHGISSIIILLSQIYKKRILPEFQNLIEDILNKSVKYILNQKLDNKSSGCYFPSTSSENEMLYSKSRLAWCYGDLGIAVALLHAGKAVNKKEYITLAMEVFQFAAIHRRNLNENFVYDAGICHGTAGIAQIFFRLAKETNNTLFQEAYTFWQKQTLNMAIHPNGLAGFMKYNPINNKWENEYSLLEGISGIGLMLLSQINSNWDELLLLNINS